MPQRTYRSLTQANIVPHVLISLSILCCDCGAAIDGTTSVGARCYDCVKLNVDISQGIPREAVLHTCRDCDRWMMPPSSWVVAGPETKELLGVCLKKLKGLAKVKLTDARFIWTEPHSRRIRVKLTVQGEYQGAIMQHAFEVEFVVAYQQCPDCQKSYTHNTWRAVVQVRQKVPHKRTFLYLEQLILKHSAHRDAINIKEISEGIDFFFAQRNHAEKFVDFLSSVAPVHVKKSQELISMDIHTSTKSYKFSFSVELVPICKDDLVALPLKLAKSIGNISPLALCYRVGTSINLIDPTTLHTADISTKEFWHTPFKPLADVPQLIEYIVLNIEVDHRVPPKGRFVLADIEVARESDFNTTYRARTHLGGLLHEGDSVMGYHMVGTNFNSPEFEVLENSRYANNIPDVVLVKKHYARKKKSRNWKVKRMAKDEGEMLPRKQDQERLERDFELFLRDVEEDTELRQTLALYKAQQQREADEMSMAETEATDEGGLRIPMEQLLDEMEGMDLGDAE